LLAVFILLKLFYIVLLQNLQTALNNASENARITGDALLSPQDSSTDKAAVRKQMDALSSRVDELKGKMTRFEEHYNEHMRKATEFQLAVERLLEKFAGRKEELLVVDIDTTDGQAIKKRIEELEVSFLIKKIFFFRITLHLAEEDLDQYRPRLIKTVI